MKEIEIWVNLRLQYWDLIWNQALQDCLSNLITMIMYFLEMNTADSLSELFAHCELVTSIFFILNHSLAEHDMPCFSKQCSSRSVKKPTDLDLHCLSLNMWISIKIPDQVIWLAGNYKWMWQLNLFSMTRVKMTVTFIFQLGRAMRKFVFEHMRTAKAQISQRISVVL